MDPESANGRDSQDQVATTWRGYLWDTWELPRDQRRLLFKVDAFVLTFSSIGYFLKNLDQTNVNNAFLSGMKEDLGMFGNELVTSASGPSQTGISPQYWNAVMLITNCCFVDVGTSIWTVGYVIGQIPSNLLLTRISPRYVIPSLEVGWGIATICTASVQSYKALYALRFLVGFFEYVL
jgi:MFS family permease